MTRFRLQSLMGVVLIIFLAGFGCTKTKPVLEPSCARALSSGLSNLSDNQVADILDKALAQNQMSDCWKPLIKICLDRNRSVPQRHLTKAVDAFNTVGTEPYFHKAVFRYFSNIVQEGPSAYRDVDRNLLLAYSQFVIRHATTKTDPNLRNAEQFCRRLDYSLHQKLFN